MARMEWFVRKYTENIDEAKILDVGSYNVNGCYKELFEIKNFNYRGLDMEEGPNVDIVPKNTYDWTEIKNDNYDITISGQALEHIEFFWVTVSEMIRVTKKGGLICIIAPNGFEEHRYPVDCWRFFTDGMVALARYYSLDIIHAHTNSAPSVEDHEWYSEDCGDTMLIARKPYSGKANIIDLKDYKCIPGNHEGLSNGMANYKTYKEYMLSKKKEEEEELKKKTEMIKKGGETHINRLVHRAKRLKDKAKNIIKKAMDKEP